MRPARVRLIDLGIDEDFDASTIFAQSLVRSLLARDERSPAAEVELIRSRDPWVVRTALQAEAALIHLMAHGDKAADEVGLWGEDGESGVALPDLAEQFAGEGWGIRTGTLFLDCCSSAHGRFIEAVRHCIEEPLAYIGATRAIDWRESTTFTSAFYGAYLKDRGRGFTALERGTNAAERAIAGYKAIVAGLCPYKVTELRPSRKAKRAFSPSP